MEFGRCRSVAVASPITVALPVVAIPVSAPAITPVLAITAIPAISVMLVLRRDIANHAASQRPTHDSPWITAGEERPAERAKAGSQ